MEIDRLKKENTATIQKYKWMKGHQIKERPSVDEKLNDWADQLATVSMRLNVKITR